MKPLSPRALKWLRKIADHDGTIMSNEVDWTYYRMFMRNGLISVAQNRILNITEKGILALRE
jgi:hypothetical protein